MWSLARGRRTSVLSIASTLIAGTAAEAREPGVAPAFPPGQTLGIPIAVPLPPGVYLGSRTSYYNAAVINNEGRYAGQRLNVYSTGIHLTWSTDWKVLGAAYRMHLLQGFAYVQQSRTDPLPRALRGDASQIAPANLKLHFIDLSWSLGGDIYANLGFGIFFPTGQWSATTPVNIGANFWTFEPTAALTYFKFPWSATLHAVYDINTPNRQNRYLSGDQLFLNATLTRNVSGFNIGPVAYWQKQVTADYNGGGRSTFGGLTAPPSQQTAVGITIGRQVNEKLYLQFLFTQDVHARNAVQGSRAWFNATFKMY